LEADKFSSSLVTEVQRSIFKVLCIAEARLIEVGVLSDVSQEVIAL
jgi:hypothetical protein